MNDLSSYLHYFAFNVYPYICLVGVPHGQPRALRP